MQRLSSNPFTLPRARTPQNCGVIFPLGAAVALAILVVLFVLGVDTVLYKYLAQRLRLQVEDICAQASRMPMIQKSAAITFRNRINALRIPGLKITAARLFAPTMLEEKDGLCEKPTAAGAPDFLCHPKYPNDFTCGSHPDTFPVSGLPQTAFNQVFGSGGRCNLPGGVDCEFMDSFCDSYSGRYPALLLDPIEQAGGVVGCEVEAEVQGLMMGGKLLAATGGTGGKVVARSMWGRTVRGTHYSPSDVSSPKLEQISALTIAVATELELPLPKNDNRFTFDIGGFATIDEGDFPEGTAVWTKSMWQALYAPYDPLHRESGSLSNLAFKDDRARVEYSPSGPSIAPFTKPADWNDAGKGREELLNACMNPAVLMRNTFLRTIVELASRYGELANRTEILHINPKHSVNDLTKLNPPTALVEFGEDLTARAYQLPYLTLRSTAAPAPTWFRPGGAASLVGWFNPLSRADADTWKPAVSMFVEQVRACYSLYGGPLGTPSRRVKRATAPWLDNVGFENFAEESDPSFDAARYTDAGKLFVQTELPDPHPWEQECPWWGTCTPTTTKSLTAAELVSILGVTQSCPVEKSNFTEGSCTKEIFPLDPDFYSFARYSAVNSSPALRAFRRPGLHPLITSETPTEEKPFSEVGGTQYKERRNFRSHILIVTHTPPTADDVIKLKDFYFPVPDTSAAEEERKRIFTVVYFPTTRDEVGPALLRFKDAYGVQEPDEGSADDEEPNKNMIYVFTPYDPKYDIGGGHAAPGEPYFGGLTNETTRFVNYWRYMLDPGMRNNIYTAALDIFLERILRPELKF